MWMQVGEGKPYYLYYIIFLHRVCMLHRSFSTILFTKYIIDWQVFDQLANNMAIFVCAFAFMSSDNKHMVTLYQTLDLNNGFALSGSKPKPNQVWRVLIPVKLDSNDRYRSACQRFATNTDRNFLSMMASIYNDDSFVLALCVSEKEFPHHLIGWLGVAIKLFFFLGTFIWVGSNFSFHKRTLRTHTWKNNHTKKLGFIS